MASYEYVGNLHIHTPYSDGAEYHAKIAEAALLVGLDFLVFTDHNVRIGGIEGYYGDDDQGYGCCRRRGSRSHPQPACNHVLVYQAEAELTTLIRLARCRAAGGLIAHPDDHDIDWLGEPAIPWLDRFVDGFTGLEIWNFMSGFKDHIQTRREALRNVFRPEEVVVGPSPYTLALWDDLLSQDRKVVGIGSADAHGTVYRLGPISHPVFAYDFLFSAVNTHILTKAPLNGDLEHDRHQLYQALRNGRAFIGYDIPGNTRGFRYSGQGQNASVVMGESIRLGHGITLRPPRRVAYQNHPPSGCGRRNQRREPDPRRPRAGRLPH